MQFLKPEFFILLWAIPILFVLASISKRIWQSRIQSLGLAQTIITKLMPDYRKGHRGIQTFYIACVIFFGTLALARPQWGEEKRKIERKGVDVIFLLDTSLSMLAEDIKPSRLFKAKLEIKSIVKRLKGDRIGIVAFAGSSFLQSPLTLDYSAFLLFLDGIKTGYIPDPGTSLDQAVRLSLQSFPEENLKHKTILLFTDGEDHGGNIDQMLEEAKEAGIRIYSIGVGTEDGEPIPLKDEQGRRAGFKKDRSGQIVITKLNKPLLERIASETGGLYLPSTPSEQEIDLIFKHMETLGQKRFNEKIVTEREDHFQLFLFFALFFLCLEMFVRTTKKIKTTPLAILACFFLFSGFLQSPKSLNDKGSEFYGEKKYQSAVDQYRKAKIKDPDDPKILYNLGTALYQSDEFSDASQEFEKAIEKVEDKNLKAQLLYNYGNSQYRLGKFEEAIESYKEALEINPDDKDAKYNLEFLENKKSLFDQKNDKQDPNKQQQNQQQDPQNQEDQQQQQQSSQQEQNEDQQNQGQDQQDQQGQQDQDQQQQDQQQDQQDQQSQQQSEQQEGEEQKSGAQGQGEQQEDQDKGDQQQQGQGQEQEDQQEKEGDQQEQEAPEPQNEGQGPEKPQPMSPSDQGQERPEGQADQQKKGQKPLQGQMTIESALRVLDALKEAEKDLQDLRRPPPPKNPPQVAKDW